MTDWKAATFTIEASEYDLNAGAYGPRGPVEMRGWTFGSLAISDNPTLSGLVRYWAVTHIPTGLRIGPQWWSRDGAQMLAECIEHMADWPSVTTDSIPDGAAREAIYAVFDTIMRLEADEVFGYKEGDDDDDDDDDTDDD